MTTSYSPQVRLVLNGFPVPAAMRGSITAVRTTLGMGDADRLEIDLANEALRWLDHYLLRLDTPAELWLGYAPDEPIRVFAGEVVGTQATFPSGQMPTLSVIAQDRRTRLAASAPSRWFAVDVPKLGMIGIPDPLVASELAHENGLLPTLDPIGGILSSAMAFVETYASLASSGAGAALRMGSVRRQTGQNSLEMLKRIAVENAWDITIDHAANPAGLVVSLRSPASHLFPDLRLKYGQSLLDFSPKVNTVGQVVAVAGRVWLPAVRLELTVSVGFDWDRQALDIKVLPGFGMPIGNEPAQVTVVDKVISPAQAPRIILGTLLPLLNKRLTATGSCVGKSQIRPGGVLQIEGVGETFGGLWRVTETTHTLDAGGWRTGFSLRKEIWFGSILPASVGAVRVQGGLLSLGL